MKKILSVIVVCALVFSLAGCGSSETDSSRESITVNENTAEEKTAETGGTIFEEVSEKAADESETKAAAGNAGNALVVYFSWSGNTESVANAIVDQTGANVFEIVPEETYTNDYDTLLDIAAEEKESGARPAIAGSIEDIAQYDVIYVGYPIWWGDMPQILYTFFDTYDFSGKTIAPFCTSGGSGLSGTPGTIARLEEGAEVLDGLHISDSKANSPESSVSQWFVDIGQAE